MRAGAWGIVTNFREFGRRRRNAPSRGGLIPGLSRGRQRAGRISARARDRRTGFRGLQSAARRPRIAVVRLQSRRPVCARAAAGDLRAFQRISRYSLAEARASAGALRRPDAVDQGIGPRCLRLGPFRDAGRPRTRATRQSCLPAICLPNGRASFLRHSCWIRVMAHAARRSSQSRTQGALRIAERRFDANGAAAGQSEHVLNETDEH